ncbi:MAG: hypothetical protein M1388_02970, partial [Thaumarchaeota archaeon]|nr:hypothetical protein [Nitrososphaerota archaeon]
CASSYGGVQKEENELLQKLDGKIYRGKKLMEGLHTFSRMKKFRVMGEEFRNRPKSYDMVTDIVSGLVNLRIIGA